MNKRDGYLNLILTSQFPFILKTDRYICLIELIQFYFIELFPAISVYYSQSVRKVEPVIP